MKVTSVLAGAVGLAVMAASPAMACSDRDAGLKLSGRCGEAGAVWTVSNPNGYQIPFAWKDNTGGHSTGNVQAPAQGSVVLPTHAAKVIVTSYRPDQDGRDSWQGHGAAGSLTCASDTPKPPASTPATTPSAGHKTATPTPTPSKGTTETPSPSPTTSTPEGEAPPATPVTKTPTFTG